MSDVKELKDEELEKVSGGITQNADGTYNIPSGQVFYLYDGNYLCVVQETYLNATLNTKIRYEKDYSYTMPNGETLVDYIEVKDTLSDLFGQSTLGRSL